MFTIDEWVLISGIAIMALWLKYFLGKHETLSSEQFAEYKKK